MAFEIADHLLLPEIKLKKTTKSDLEIVYLPHLVHDF